MQDKSLKSKAIQIKGKDYVLVSDRVLYFNEQYPNGAIITERIKDNPEMEVIKATVIPDVKNPERKFTGYSQAIRGDGYINKTSALENSETSAVGRALAFMGIGVIESIASVDEINKAESATQSNSSTQSKSTYNKKSEEDKPRFNDPELKDLKEKTEFIKSFEFADLLIDEIKKDYKVSNAKSTELFNLRDEVCKPRTNVSELPF